jgi:hypothetical protein
MEPFMNRRLSSLCLVLALAAPTMPAFSHGHGHGGASELSALSMLPVAVSVAAPVALLVSGAALTVVAVEAASGATVWVLERASDGAQASVTLSGAAVGGLSLAAGTVVTCTAFSAGWVLSTAGKAIAYIPNELGRALMHNERITR